MFDQGHASTCSDGVVAALVATWTEALATSSSPEGDAARLDLIAALERLTCAAAALQAEAAVDVDASMRRRAAERGVPTARQGLGVVHEIALARRESPHRAQQHLGLAKVLRAEMPHTWAAFRVGRISEWRSTIVARETACLSREDRGEVDRRVAHDAEALEQMGDREVGDAVRRTAYQLDAEAWVTRRRIAESERRVTLRPAPDVMSRLSAELPVAQGVAVYRTLGEHADSLRAAGDRRSRSQLHGRHAGDARAGHRAPRRHCPSPRMSSSPTTSCSGARRTPPSSMVSVPSRPSWRESSPRPRPRRASRNCGASMSRRRPARWWPRTRCPASSPVLWHS